MSFLIEYGCNKMDLHSSDELEINILLKVVFKKYEKKCELF